MLTEENVRSGMSPEDARRAALIRVGARESTKEQHREERGLPWLDTMSAGSALHLPRHCART